jgi:hypothetical protein
MSFRPSPVRVGPFPPLDGWKDGGWSIKNHRPAKKAAFREKGKISLACASKPP